MTLRKRGFDESLRDYEAAMEWATSLIGFRQGRHQQYLKDLRHLVQCYEDVDNGKQRLKDLEARRPDKALYNTLLEVDRLVKVWRGFEAYQGEGLQKRLRDFFKGPERYTEETVAARSNAARDTGYELLLGAEFSLAGLQVDLAHECDLVLSYQGTTIYVECKRAFPQTADISTATNYRVEGLLRKGYDQVKGHIRNHPGEAYGFVSCSIEKIIDSKFHIPTVRDVAEIRGALEHQISKFFDANIDLVWSADSAGVLGAMASVHTLFIVDPPNMVTQINQHGVTPLGERGDQRYNLMIEISHAVMRSLGVET